MKEPNMAKNKDTRKNDKVVKADASNEPEVQLEPTLETPVDTTPVSEDVPVEESIESEDEIDTDIPLEESIESEDEIDTDIPLEESHDTFAPVVEEEVVAIVPPVRQAGTRRVVEGLYAVVPTMTEVAPSLADSLSTFIAELTPNSGSTPHQQMAAQVRFYNSLVSVFQDRPEGIREVNDELIAIFRSNSKGACGIAYMLRNMDNIRLSTAQRQLFESLLHLYRTAAVQGRKAATNEVDIPAIVAMYKKAYPAREMGASVLSELFKE